MTTTTTTTTTTTAKWRGALVLMASVACASTSIVGCSAADNVDETEDEHVEAMASASSGHGVTAEDSTRDLVNRNPDNRPSVPMAYPDVYFQPAVTGGPGSCGYAAVSNILRLWLPRDHMHYEGYTPQWVMGEIGYRSLSGMLHSDAAGFLNASARNDDVRAGDWDYMTGAVFWNDTGWENFVDYLREGRPWGVSLNSCKWGNWSTDRNALLEDECMANRFWGVPMSHWVVAAGAKGEGDNRQVLVMENGNYSWIPWQNFDLRMDVAAARYATFYPTAGRAATHLVVPENAQSTNTTGSCRSYRTEHPHDLCGGPCNCASEDGALALRALCDSDETCRTNRAKFKSAQRSTVSRQPSHLQPLSGS
jgi:hypothetical protein